MHHDISSFSSSIQGTEITYVEDFLSADLCNYLVQAVELALSDRSYADNLYEYINDGKKAYDDSPYIYLFHHPDTKVQLIVKDIVKRSIEIYEDRYEKDPNIEYINLGTVVTMRSGVGLEVHSDDGPSLNKNIATPHGMVLYLNDDYEGGEIYYPDLKIAIKPKIGSLVIHPGTPDYSHGVLPVSSGIRYSSTAFVKKKL
jgi:hypothetical protein